MVFPQEEIIRISDCMRANGIIMHCDGARMWEVAAKTGMSLEELCRPFDTVSLCLSKGLGAPVGSVLVGPRKFIVRLSLRRLCSGVDGTLTLSHAVTGKSQVVPQGVRWRDPAVRFSLGLGQLLRRQPLPEAQGDARADELPRQGACGTRRAAPPPCRCVRTDPELFIRSPQAFMLLC